MDFRKLRYALAVAKERSFTQAARKVHVSQSAISEQVRLLEEEIGFPIFNRTSHGIQLTDRGRSFLNEAERVYNDLLALSDTARHLHGGESFVIGMGSGVAQFVVPGALAHFSATFPDVRLEVKIAPTRRVYDQLHNERIDMGIAVESDPERLPAGIVQKRIAETEMVLIVPADHELSGRNKPVDLAELATLPLIINELSVGYGLIVQTMFEGIGVRPKIANITDNIETMKIMVESGMGVALMPRACIEPVPADAGIRVKSLSKSHMITFCVLRRQRPMPESREKHYAFLCDALGEAAPA